MYFPRHRIGTGLSPAVLKGALMSILIITRKVPTIAVGIILLSAISAGAALTHRWSFTETNGPIVDSKGAADGQVVVVGGGIDVTRTNGFIRLAGGARNSADYVQFPAGLVEGVSNVTI